MQCIDTLEIPLIRPQSKVRVHIMSHVNVDRKRPGESHCLTTIFEKGKKRTYYINHKVLSILTY